MTYEFILGTPPFGYAYNFENYLFNRAAHINTQGNHPRLDFFLANHVRKRVEAKIHFLLDDGVACSPYKSLFGSFEMNRNIASGMLTEFTNFIENGLLEHGVRAVRITHCASAYAPLKARKIRAVLESLNYDLSWQGVNHHIPVEGGSLRPRMHTMERRRLVKCDREGLYVRQDEASAVVEIYRFIEDCRAEQGLKPSIGQDRLQMYLERFPVDYVLFTVRGPQEQIYAATVAVRVCRRILYNFLPASPAVYRKLSPTVMLLEGMHEYCCRQQFEMLDLGVSTTAEGVDQNTLIDFKKRMGGVPSDKWTFAKEISR